jgi:hypothetical protein
VHERGSDDPDDLAAPLLLLAEQLRQHRVIHGPLAGHLGLHEPELVGAVDAAEEALDVHVDPLAPVLRLAERDGRTPRHLAGLRHHELAGRVEHDRAVHAGKPRAPPRAGDLEVGRQVRGRKKAVGKDPVGGCGLEAGVGSRRERGRVEVRRSVLEARTLHARGLRSQERKHTKDESLGATAFWADRRSGGRAVRGGTTPPTA